MDLKDKLLDSHIAFEEELGPKTVFKSFVIKH